MFLASASVVDGEIAPILLEGTMEAVLGNRNYWLPDLQTFLRNKGLLLQVPFRHALSPKAVTYHNSVLGRISVEDKESWSLKEPFSRSNGRDLDKLELFSLYP